MALKLKFRTKFPAIVSALSPLTLVKAGLRYTFGLDINVLRTSLDPIYASVGFTSGVDANILHSVVSDYTIAISDSGKTIQAGTGSTGLFTITLPPVAGFAGNAVVTVINGDTTRGKMLSGFPSDLYPCLFPRQALQVKIVNGVWATSVNPGPWHPQSSVTLYVDPVLGSNTLTDGLASAAGALATVFHAFQVFQSVIGCPAGASPTIQLPLGGGTSATSLVIANSVTRIFTTQASLGYSGARVRAASAANPANFMEGVCSYSGTTLTMTVDTIGGSGTKTDWVLSYVFTETPSSQILGAVPSGTGAVGVVGNETTPTACRWKSAGITVCNGAVLSLRGFDVCTVSSAQVFLTIDKDGTVVFANMSWGSAVGGSNVVVKNGGRFVWDGGTYKVGDATTAPNCFSSHIANYGGYVSIEQSLAISVPYALTFSAWYLGFNPGSVATFGGGTSFTGTGSGAGSAGYQFAVQSGASIARNGAVLPGNTAGYSASSGFIDFAVTPPDMSSGTGPIKTTSSGGIGYATGAGGTVTQLTNKATTVTINKISGLITMNNAALGAGATASFLLSNSTIAVGDFVHLAIDGGIATLATYRVVAEIVGSFGGGGVFISLTNISAGSLSEAVVIKFYVFKTVST